MTARTTQIAIAGAGPVGTVAAYALSQAGIDVILLEAGHECAADLRASTFHPPTLEMLDEFGIAEKLIRLGLKAPVYHFRERETGEVIDFDMSELQGETRFPFRLQCEQYHLSRMLAELVENQSNAEVLFNHRLVAFRQDQDGVDVFAETPTEIIELRADFLIGADGANSIVRKWLGIEFDGFTYEEKFACYTTPTPLEDYLPNLCHVNYVSDPQEWMVLLRVPSLWRILLPAPDNLSDEEITSDDRTNQIFQQLIGQLDVVETRHRTVYRVHQRVAKEFVSGRVALIGDAAHLNNPLGGFGMNSGIHDAFNLSDKLVKIFKKGADADVALGTFSRQRRQTTFDFIQKQTIANMQYLSAGQRQAHLQRKKNMREIREDPAKRREYLLQQSMIRSLRMEAES